MHEVEREGGEQVASRPDGAAASFFEAESALPAGVDANPGAPSADPPDHGALLAYVDDDLHEAAHDGGAGGDEERPGLGKPSEIADHVESADARGAARPDIAGHLTSLHQLAQPRSEKADDGALDKLVHEAAHAPQLALDQVRDPHALDAAVRDAEAKIDADHDTRVAKAVEHHEKERDDKKLTAEQQRKAVEERQQQTTSQHQRSGGDAHAHKHLNKDELKAKLTAAAHARCDQLDQTFDAKKTELDGKLDGRAASGDKELADANQAITTGVDGKAKQLDGDVAKRKAAHDAEIAKKRPALEAQVAREQASVRAKAKADADRIRAEGHTQADQTYQNAIRRAADTEAKGETEAHAAIAAGDAQAHNAVAAANARAGALKGGEASHVQGEGSARADIAHSQATARADQLRAQAKSSAQSLRAKADADRDAVVKRAEARAAEAIKNGEAAAAKIAAKLTQTVGAMQGESTGAVAKMQGEIAIMRVETETKRATLNAHGGKALADAHKSIDGDKSKALADMQASHDKAKKAIEDELAKELAKLDASDGKNLGKLETEVDRDIRKIDQTAKQATASIDRSVADADRKAAIQISRAKATIKADRARALVALQQSAAKAKQRIAADDKGTKKKIDAAATQGGKDIADVSAQAAAELATANQQLVDQTAKEGADKRAEADKQAADAATAMETSRKKLDGEISKAWVDDAVGKTHKLFKRGVFDWAVTDHEAVEAMNDLNSLPGPEQGQAIKQLDKDDFHKLLNEVPDDRREEFKSLVDNTHDPERKLQLWGEYHKSHVANDAKKDEVATSDTGTWPLESKAQDENRRINHLRDKTVSDTKDEVDDEVAFLEKKQTAGTLTEADVVALGHRKEHEHEIERKYGVNLTNKEGARADGTKIAWSDTELDQVDSALGRVPEAATKHNPLLKRIERSDVSDDEDDKTKPRIGGDHSDGVIKIYDRGTQGGFRIDGATRELPDPRIAPSPTTPLSPIEVNLDHELGHDMHDQNADAFKRYQQAAGWQDDVGDKSMKSAGLSDADIKKLRDASKKHTHMELVGKDGKVYENDPYSKGDVVAYDKDALPDADAQRGPTGNDTWEYARSNKKDNFAEQYTKAVHMPETLAKDMLDAPAARVGSATTRRDTDRAALDAERAKTPPDPAVVKALENNLKASQGELDAANKEQTSRQTMFNIMRNDIFHSDTETSAAVKRLQAKGVDAAKIAEFQAKAARASTPQQIDVLESGY